MHPREMQTLRDVTYPSMGVLGMLVANTSLHLSLYGYFEMASRILLGVSAYDELRTP